MLNARIASAFENSRGYLDTASYGLPSRATAAALVNAVTQWHRADLDPASIDAPVDRMRAAYAAIVGSDPSHVTIAGSTSQVMGMVAASLPEGAHVLVAEEDFTSVVWPFATDPRLTIHPVPLAQLVDHVRPGIDLVAVSAAQSRNGAVVDLDAVATQASALGIKTVIDASQAAGWLPIGAHRFDVVVASGYKWLTTPRGLTFAAVRPGATWVRPVYASWYGADAPWDHLYGVEPALSAHARRLDSSPPWLLAEAGATALELMASHPIHDAYAHTTGLADEFRARLGLAPAGSAIVSIAAEPADLAAAGIRASHRAGRVRVGFHIYNTQADMERAAAVLSPLQLVAA